ncbi:MAG: Ig-like domain-containing protein [Chloroflexota bacterium]
MKHVSQLTSLDHAAGGLGIGIIALILATILLGSQIGIRVSTDFADGEVGPLSPLTLTFSTPVNAGDVEPLLALDPKTAGRVDWLDTTTMQYTPTSPLQPDTVYRMTLRPGSIGEGGELLRKEQTWTFSVRDPLIVYQSFPENRSEIWAVDKDGESPHRLVETDLRIYDFDASPNGEFIIYSAYNEQEGLDLWIVGRDGKSPSKLLDCRAGRCTIPSVSPDSAQVAYTREAAPLNANDVPGAPRIFVVDIKSQQNRPLFEDSQVLGYGAAWSPDGKWITSFDGLQDLIRVVSLETGEQVVLPSVIGSYLTWSPDSSRLAFIDAEDTPDGLRTVINIADFKTGEVGNLLGRRDAFDFGYGSVAWSPADPSQMVIGMRATPEEPAQGLWLIDIDTLSGTAIANEENVTYQAPRWGVWGNAVLFQHFKLGEAAQPQISLWETGVGQPRILAEGLSPAWLP